MGNYEHFNFNISLSVLNHLGRNLYRNLITVIGEAISNSWDADAHNVWIKIDKANNKMIIFDDGIGMNDDDFQNKFLKIGYSKRKGNIFATSSGRPFIGRKGIGKLALLSCSKKIQVLSKYKENEIIGGVIDNTELDKAITDDLSSQEYTLGNFDLSLKKYFGNKTNGTLIYFEDFIFNIPNTIEYIKKSLAMYFRFSLYDKNFNIFVNNEQITENNIKEFAETTQFRWIINSFTDPYFSLMNEIQESKNIESKINIKGYIATVEKPSQLKVRGTQEKVTVDLFVNGRLREKDILRHIPTNRIVENYVYGQIHFDELDIGQEKDYFTSSREGIVSDAPLYSELLKELERIFKNIIEDWDNFRREHSFDGDPDNDSVSPKQRKAEELFNASIKDFQGTSKIIKKGGKIEEWVKLLSQEAQFNIPSYTDCFISENLLRKYILHSSISLTPEALNEAKKWKDRDKNNKNLANISYDVRASSEDLYYLDMDHLANLVDKPQDKLKDAGIGRSAITYKPIRDAVGHTSIVTPIAKQQLTIVYENIKARLIELLQEMDG